MSPERWQKASLRNMRFAVVLFLAGTALRAICRPTGVFREEGPSDLRRQLLRMPWAEDADVGAELLFSRRLGEGGVARRRRREQAVQGCQLCGKNQDAAGREVKGSGHSRSESLDRDPARSLPKPAATAAASPMAARLAEGKKYWAFQPVQTPTPPKVKNEKWVKSPIDRFILAKLEEKVDSAPAPAAKLTLLRRATFDLTGLPPTLKEIENFLADNSPDAFAKVVDRLLASPQYGERGAGTGSMSPAMPIPPVWTKTTSIRMPGVIAITSSRRSTRTAVRSIRPRTDRRRFAAARQAGRGERTRRDRDRASWPWVPSRSRSRIACRPIYDVVDEQIDTTTKAVHGPDGRLRPLPRSQVRSDSHQGLLCAGRHLRQHGNLPEPGLAGLSVVSV